MKKELSFCLILVMLIMLGLSIPSLGEKEGAVADPNQATQASTQTETVWTLPNAETRFTHYPGLRMMGSEGWRYTEKMFISFGKSVHSNSFDIRRFNTEQSLRYKQALEQYAEIRPVLPPVYFLAKKMLTDRLWVKPSSQQL